MENFVSCEEHKQKIWYASEINDSDAICLYETKSDARRALADCTKGDELHVYTFKFPQKISAEYLDLLLCAKWEIDFPKGTQYRKDIIESAKKLEEKRESEYA
jgi:hypothetical protein